MSVDHPFRTALYDGDIRIRLADGWDMPRIFDIWSHPSFISMFPEYEADGCAPDPEWLSQLLRSSVSRGRILAIESNEHGLVGTLVVHYYRSASPTIGWYVDVAHRGEGYATRAAMLAIDHLENLYDEVRVSIAQDNHASRRVAQKLGYPFDIKHDDAIDAACDEFVRSNTDLLDCEAMRPAA